MYFIISLVLCLGLPSFRRRSLVIFRPACRGPDPPVGPGQLTVGDGVDGDPDPQDAKVGPLLHPVRQGAVSDPGGRPRQPKDGDVAENLRVGEVDGDKLGHGCLEQPAGTMEVGR